MWPQFLRFSWYFSFENRLICCLVIWKEFQTQVHYFTRTNIWDEFGKKISDTINTKMQAYTVSSLQWRLLTLAECKTDILLLFQYFYQWFLLNFLQIGHKIHLCCSMNTYWQTALYWWFTIEVGTTFPPYCTSPFKYVLFFLLAAIFICEANEGNSSYWTAWQGWTY
jgi:hypothetical protein